MSDSIQRNSWIFGKCNNILNDKEALNKQIISQMLNKTITIFKYGNLPETITEKDIEIITDEKSANYDVNMALLDVVKAAGLNKDTKNLLAAGHFFMPINIFTTPSTSNDTENGKYVTRKRFIRRRGSNLRQRLMRSMR